MSTDLMQSLKSTYQVRSNFLLLSHRVGYSGYIPGIKSEGVFGLTQGNASLASQTNTFHVGRDQPANIKYTTTMKENYVNH